VDSNKAGPKAPMCKILLRITPNLTNLFRAAKSAPQCVVTDLWLHLLLLLHHGSVVAGPKGLSDYAENENLCRLLLR
jgi:hypothetical protein